MAAPIKPWERPGVNCNSLNYTTTLPRSTVNNFINEAPGTAQGLTNSTTVLNTNIPINPPPLPPRPTTYQNFNQYGGSPYGGGYGYSPYSSMLSSPYSMSGSPYSMSYGGGYGMNRYGYSNFGPYSDAGTFQNGFIQMAEENSRPAFQSIEAIVHAVGSVSMMLESTYNALYSSFRAVLGVAHHFSHMKSQITQILSALAIVRSLRWLYRKVLYMLGIRKINPMNEDIWSTLSKNINEGNLAEGDVKRGRSSWPIILFLAVVFGGPWLIWKLIVSISGSNEAEVQTWMTGKGPHYIGVALYNFRGQTQNELSFAAKQTLRIAPKELQPRIKGWLLASIDGKTTGLVPGNYVRIFISQPTAAPQSTATAQPVPLSDIAETKNDINSVDINAKIPELPSEFEL